MTIFEIVKNRTIFDIAREKLLTEDAEHYEIGEISKKTGKQKCLINGNIVWLLPSQKSDYLQTRMTKADSKDLASSAKLARADGSIIFGQNIRQSARKYLNYMQTSWTKNPVKARYLKNAEIRLNNMSYKHLFETKGKPRPVAQIKERAECLPYVRDILERSGKPADHTIDANGKESYTIVGRANINKKDRNIKVVISRNKNDEYFYLSVFEIK